MIVDPWGRVVAKCGAEGDDLVTADITKQGVDQVRAKLPLVQWAQ